MNFEIKSKEEAYRMLCAMMMCQQSELGDDFVGCFVPVVDRVAEEMMKDDPADSKALFTELLKAALESDELKRALIRQMSEMRRERGN